MTAPTHGRGESSQTGLGDETAPPSSGPQGREEHGSKQKELSAATYYIEFNFSFALFPKQTEVIATLFSSCVKVCAGSWSE